MKTILDFDLPETDEEYMMCLLENKDYIKDLLNHVGNCSKRPREYDLELLGLVNWLTEQAFFDLEFSQRSKYIRIAQPNDNPKEKITGATRINRTHSEWYYKLCYVATENIYKDYF